MKSLIRLTISNKMQNVPSRGIILSRTRVKKGPFKIGPPVIGYIFSYNQLCEVDHH